MSKKMSKKRASAVSVIGGADGPTSVFILGKKEKNLFPEERELLRKQLVLLAEQSKNVNLEIHELAELSEQMVAIYSVLQV